MQTIYQPPQVMADLIVSRGNDDLDSSEMQQQWRQNLTSFLLRGDNHEHNQEEEDQRLAQLQKKHPGRPQPTKPQDPFKTVTMKRVPALATLRALHQAVGFAGFPLWRFKPDPQAEEAQDAEGVPQQDPRSPAPTMRTLPLLQSGSGSRSQVPPATVGSGPSLQVSTKLEQSSQESSGKRSQVPVPAGPCRLMVSMDEGGINMAAMSYLLEKQNLDLVILRDPAHREWNDVKNAFNQAGLKTLLMETTFVLNLPYGPWEGARWFHSNKEACNLINRHLKPTDPLAELIARLVGKDIKTDAFWQRNTYDEHLGAEDTPEQSLLNPDFFASKGDKVSLTRWFQWIKAVVRRFPSWHSHLAVMLFQGIHLGYIKTQTDFGELFDDLRSIPLSKLQLVLAKLTRLTQPTQADAECKSNPKNSQVLGPKAKSKVTPSLRSDAALPAAAAAAPSLAPAGPQQDASTGLGKPPGDNEQSDEDIQDDKKEPTARDSVNALRARCPAPSSAATKAVLDRSKQDRSCCGSASLHLRFAELQQRPPCNKQCANPNQQLINVAKHSATLLLRGPCCQAKPGCPPIRSTGNLQIMPNVCPAAV